MEEAENFMRGRITSVSKRFRDPGNTDTELKKIEAKKKRSENKQLKAYKAKAHALNIEYFISATTYTIYLHFYLLYRISCGRKYNFC